MHISLIAHLVAARSIKSRGGGDLRGTIATLPRPTGGVAICGGRSPPSHRNAPRNGEAHFNRRLVCALRGDGLVDQVAVCLGGRPVGRRSGHARTGTLPSVSWAMATWLSIPGIFFPRMY
jgi:hypothetical protein